MKDSVYQSQAGSFFKPVPLGFWLWLLALGTAFFLFLMWLFYGQIPKQIQGYGVMMLKGELVDVTAPVKGVLKEVWVKEGQLVRAGDPLVLFEDSLPVVSPISGQVLEITAWPFTRVQTGDLLALLGPLGDVREDLLVHAYVSSLEGRFMRPGMEVEVELEGFKKERYGYLKGQITHVSPFASTDASMVNYFKIPEISRILKEYAGEAPLYIEVSLNLKKASQSGYEWTTRDPGRTLEAGSFAKVYVTLENKPPIEWILPRLGSFLWEK